MADGLGLAAAILRNYLNININYYVLKVNASKRDVIGPTVGPGASPL